MKSLRLFCVVLCAFLPSAGELSAGIIVTSSAAAPTTNIIASYDLMNDGNAYWWRWIGDAGLNRVEMGQSFAVAPGNDMLADRLTLRAREHGTAVLGQDYRLDIWEFSDASDTTGNALISTQLGTLPVSGLTTPSYWTFDFDDVLLTAGKQYGIMLAFTEGADSQRYVHFVQDFVTGYSGGRLVSRAGTPPDWDFGGRDLTFYVQGSAAVPEPSSILLLTVGAGVAVVLARRRRSSQKGSMQNITE